MLHWIWSTCGIQLNQACETHKQKSASINDLNGRKPSQYDVCLSDR